MFNYCYTYFLIFSVKMCLQVRHDYTMIGVRAYDINVACKKLVECSYQICTCSHRTICEHGFRLSVSAIYSLHIFMPRLLSAHQVGEN